MWSRGGEVSIQQDVICHQCGKTGHLRRACKSSEGGGGMRKQKNRSLKTVSRVHDEEEGSSDSGHYNLCQVRSGSM